MKNVNTITEQITANREQWFKYRRTMEANLSALETIYAAQYDAESPLYHSTPAQTVAAFVESVGYETAVEIVASLVNSSAWDGRISRTVSEWASIQENAWDEEACSRLSIYTNRIHMAHLDQIAAAMMKYEPSAEPQEATEEATDTVFPALRAALGAYYEEQKEAARQFVKLGFMPSWAEEHRHEPDRGLKQHSTPAKWEAYNAGTLSREKAVEIATRRALKEIEKEAAQKFRKLDSVENAPVLDWLQVSVDWKRSNEYGYNPSVTVYADNMTTCGHAGGCGYDKESAAVAEALNNNPAVLKALYTLKERGLRAGLSDHSGTACTGKDNRDICGYGSGYAVLPYFEGGVGVSCFWSILTKCGYSCRSSSAGKHFNGYSMSRTEVA